LDAVPVPLPGKRPSGTRGIVWHLRLDLGLTESDLASATGASTRTVRRWLADDVDQPQARYAQRIDDLRAVIEVLEDSLTPKGIRQWLHARNRLLAGARPIDSLSKGNFDAVHKAADAFAQGYYV
jgi:transcriptional regulator with XRE-family HTH domain